MFGISMWEIMLVALVLFALVGPGKIPEIAKTVGKALGSFRRSVDEVKKEVNLDEELDFLKEVRNEVRDVSVYDVLSEKDPVNPSVDLPAGPVQKTPARSGRKRVRSGRKGLGKVLFGEGRSGGGKKTRAEGAQPDEVPAKELESETETDAETGVEKEKETVAEMETEIAKPKATDASGPPGHMQRGLPLAEGDLRQSGGAGNTGTQDPPSEKRRRVKPGQPS